MFADDRSSPYRSRFRRIELPLSLLLLAAIAVIGLSISAILHELAATIAFLTPVCLGVVALVSSGFDMYLITWKKASRIKTNSRWLLLGQLVVASVTGLLAAATLFIVIQTILIVTVIDTQGGVILGPFLWMFTGSILAVVILLRSIVETFPIDDTPIFPGRSPK